jgi:hypothetical protein
MTSSPDESIPTTSSASLPPGHASSLAKAPPAIETALAYSVSDAVRISGISRSGLYKLFSQGKLTPRRLGGRTLVLAADLHDFVRTLPPAPIRRRNIT